LQSAHIPPIKRQERRLFERYLYSYQELTTDLKLAYISLFTYVKRYEANLSIFQVCCCFYYFHLVFELFSTKISTALSNVGLRRNTEIPSISDSRHLFGSSLFGQTSVPHYNKDVHLLHRTLGSYVTLVLFLQLITLMPDSSDSRKQNVVMKQPLGTHASVGITESYFADKSSQAVS
jgi:hypothetical protein